MSLIGRLLRPRQVQVDDLIKRLVQVESDMRALALEQLDMHTTVRRWMRRAVAAERRLEAPRVESPARPTLWGARARMAAAAGSEATAKDNTDVAAAAAPNGRDDGVHP
jgi:hypothetical protein